MKRSVFAVVAMSCVGFAGAEAQGGGLASSVCPFGVTTAQHVAQDACQQAYDVYQFMAPQLAASVAGGNATLGQNSTLGGLGHISIGVRFNAIRGAVPKVNEFTQRSTGATPAVQLPTSDQILGLPVADAAIGIFRGVPLALTNVGGIDLLVSATYVPDYSDDKLSVKPDQNLQLGYGARIGLLSESIVVPGVSFTYLKRDLPTTTIVGTASYIGAAPIGQTTATLNVNNLKVKTSSWRLVASKSLVIVGLAAGVGQDKYDGSADISATTTSTVAGTATMPVPGATQALTRTNYFFDASLNLLLAKLTAEVGQASGGTVNTYNSFQSGRADKAQTYFAVGFRFGF